MKAGLKLELGYCNLDVTNVERRPST